MWTQAKRPALGVLLTVACLFVSAAFELARWLTAKAETASRLNVAAAVKVKTWDGFSLTERSTTTIPMPPGVPAAHASALTALPNGDLLAFWWAGERESGPDVRVYSSRWSAGQWSAAHEVVERRALARSLGFAVRRLGNPSVWVSHDGRVHLYVVATGLGGWAAGRVVQLVSADAGRTFSTVRVLPLTPLLDTSVLVRTNPIGQADGGWLLPAYFELGRKYPMLVSFDRSGNPRWVRRIGNSSTSLQPALLPVSEIELRAVMRDIGPQKRIQQAVSHDGGMSWQDIDPADIANHDSSVAALRLAEGGFVMLSNDIVTQGGSPRQWLRMSLSDDAQRWKPGLDVRMGVPGDEFSYPSVQQIGHQLHVAYTQQRKSIAHHVYDIHYTRAPK